MFIDFGQAILHNGICFLRYDDTNPEAEKQEFVDAIARVCARSNPNCVSNPSAGLLAM